jgi:chemotaxis protein methyltransferase WspC
MNVAAIAELLSRRIGLDPQTLGAEALPRIVAKRMRALRLTDPRRYAAHLAQSAEEFAALVDEVVVPETWFFRGGRLFSFLAEQVRRATAAAPRATRVRILSAPCSTGEEPYSLAIALCEAGVAREAWTIDGIDLSAASVEKARRACYRETTFRAIDDSLRDKYFRHVEKGWELIPAARSLVRFRQGNLLDSHFLWGEGPFDLIFCRNLLIYLDSEARARVMSNLDRLLAAEGLLCMGHADPLNLLDRRFQAIGPHEHFLFQRKPASQPRRPRRADPSPVHSKSASRRRRSASVVQPAVELPVDLLKRARAEADVGALDAALRSAREHLSVAEPSAEAYSLLGIIHQARHERTEAAKCFRKALYLDPHCEEALLHLMLLHQKDGNETAAAHLRRRLKRKTGGGDA